MSQDDRPMQSVEKQTEDTIQPMKMFGTGASYSQGDAGSVEGLISIRALSANKRKTVIINEKPRNEQNNDPMANAVKMTNEEKVLSGGVTAQRSSIMNEDGDLLTSGSPLKIDRIGIGLLIDDIF